MPLIERRWTKQNNERPDTLLIGNDYNTFLFKYINLTDFCSGANNHHNGFRGEREHLLVKYYLDCWA